MSILESGLIRYKQLKYLKMKKKIQTQKEDLDKNLPCHHIMNLKMGGPRLLENQPQFMQLLYKNYQQMIGTPKVMKKLNGIL